MNRELDEQLCKKYPKMMVNRHKGMQETAMCWGFECGDGWYDILDQLMGNIQHHIDWKEKQRGWAIDFNSKAAPTEYRKVPEPIVQVTLDQVKEKLGGLRFYYNGGDEYIRGLVSMAESMSEVICEECGKPGKRRSGGWIVTLCDEHAKERDERQAKRFGGEGDCD